MKKVLTKEEVRDYLRIIKGISGQNKIIDIHLHPVEIFYGNVRYAENNCEKDVYSLSDSQYVPPDIGTISFAGSNEGRKITERNDKFARMKIYHLYKHIGKRVIEDHMELGCVNYSLLLPVESSSNSVNNQMEEIATKYCGSNVLASAYCVPNRVGNEEIIDAVRDNKDQYNVKAVKVHPNITGIDLSTDEGIKRVETILEACNQLKLPIVVHGGRSPGLKNDKAGSFGVLENLANIDWSISSSPIIIAHTGAYGYKQNELETDVLPLIGMMLSKYNNMMVDMAALPLDILITLLKRIDCRRILFGSDALYERQWVSIVKLLYAITTISKRSEEIFVTIASHNPAELCLF